MTEQVRRMMVAGALPVGIALLCGMQAWRAHERGAALRDQLGAVRVEVAALEEKAARAPVLRRELHEVEGSLGEMIRILPSPEVATEEHLLELVQERLIRSGGRIAQVRIVREGR